MTTNLKPLPRSYRIGRGSHAPNGNGTLEACVMEAVAYVAGEPWSDHPQCASPVITSFLVSWNDSLNDTDRQMLRPYIRKLVGTRTTTSADEETRAWMLMDWLARECAPAFMRCAGLVAQAEMLEALAPIMSPESAKAAQPSLDQARKDSAAAGDAAWAAAGAAAGAAAWDAAGAAARAAAWAAAGAAAGDAAGAAAWAAARAAARAAAWAAAGAAARDAAGDAAWDAARAAARDAAWDAACYAACDAAWAALAPTVKQLQKSALLMLDRLIEVGR